MESSIDVVLLGFSRDFTHLQVWCHLVQFWLNGSASSADLNFFLNCEIMLNSEVKYPN